MEQQTLLCVACGHFVYHNLKTAATSNLTRISSNRTSHSAIFVGLVPASVVVVTVVVVAAVVPAELVVGFFAMVVARSASPAVAVVLAAAVKWSTTASTTTSSAYPISVSSECPHHTPPRTARCARSRRAVDGIRCWVLRCIQPAAATDAGCVYLQLCSVVVVVAIIIIYRCYCCCLLLVSAGFLRWKIWGEYILRSVSCSKQSYICV